MNVLSPVLAFTVGFILVHLSVPTIINVAKAKHLFDEPNERSASKKVVPTLGGVAIFIGLTISTIVSSNGFDFSELKYLMAACIVMLFVGLKDDILVLAAKKKLFIQIVTAIILVGFGNIRFTNFHGLLGIHEINYLTSFLFSVFVIVALINAFNLIDGIDGLASGVSILTAAVFGTWFLMTGHADYGILCIGLIGSLSAFFLYNVFGNTNKIFMGDTGSLILGVTMSVLVIKFNEFNINSNAPMAILAAPAVSIGILIVPVIDTLRVFVIRIASGKSPFSPDMNHIHHKLLKLGNSHLRATLIIVGANAFFIALSFTLSTYFNVNNLLLIVFTAGLAIGNLPSYILKYQKEEIGNLGIFSLEHDKTIGSKIKLSMETAKAKPYSAPVPAAHAAKSAEAKSTISSEKAKV